MARRQLPPRSTRGQRTSFTQDQQKKDDKIYSQLFGSVEMESQDEEERLRKQRDSQRKMAFLSNIKKYQYGRAYHYFFELNTFQRLRGHPSYAIDDQNIFNSTFSQQNKQIGQSTLKQLLNRNFFHLPITQNQERGKQPRTKNICHGYLFECEDKKYHLDRLLYTCKMILKNYDQLIPKIDTFSIIQKDPELILLTDEELSDLQKRAVLERKIKVISERKEISRVEWEILDANYFYHSLNQKLHNKITDLKKQYTMENIVKMLTSTNNLHQTFIKKMTEEGQQNQSNFSQFLRDIFRYHRSNKFYVSPASMKALKQYEQKILQLDAGDEPVVDFPIQVFDFGNQHLQKLVDEVIANKLFFSSESSFYLGKSIWKKLFKRELTIKTEQKIIPYDQYIKLGRKKVEEIKKYYKNQTKNGKKTVFCAPTLDNMINFEGLKKEQNKSFPFLNSNNQSIQISGKWYLCIVLYHWVCISLAEIYDFIASNEESMIKIISSEFFCKLFNGVVEAVGTPQIGILNNTLQMLCDVIARPDPFGEVNFLLDFKYHQAVHVGIISKHYPVEQENWETQKQDEDEEEDEEKDEQDDEDPRPKKKVKCE